MRSLRLKSIGIYSYYYLLIILLNHISSCLGSMPTLSSSATIYADKAAYTSAFEPNASYAGLNILLFSESGSDLYETYVEYNLDSLPEGLCAITSLQLAMQYESDYIVDWIDFTGVPCWFTYLEPASWAAKTIDFDNQDSVVTLGVEQETWASVSGSSDIRYVNLNATAVLSSYHKYQKLSIQIRAVAGTDVYSATNSSYITVDYQTCGDHATCVASACVVSNTGTIVGAVVGSILGVALLLLILGYIIFRKRKAHTEKELLGNEQQQQEKQQKPQQQPNSQRGFELDSAVALSLIGTKNFGDDTNPPEATLINTKLEVAVPLFLNLDFATQIRKEESIGGGGFASIFKGTLVDPQLQKKFETSDVAIKLMKDDPEFTAAENAQKFKQEVAILWHLNQNPNVITIIGYCLQPPCIITKLYKTDLYKFVHTPSIPIPVKLALQISIDVASAMAGIHRNGIAHRDLKSPNVLLETTTEGGKNFMKALICDFGMAKVPNDQLVSKNFLDLKGMSPRYTAPEVFQRLRTFEACKLEEDFKADVYSFAIILWELLTRKKPWDGCRNADEIEEKVVNSQREGLPDLQDDLIGGHLVEILKLCWSQDPQARPFFSQISPRLKELDGGLK